MLPPVGMKADFHPYTNIFLSETTRNGQQDQCCPTNMATGDTPTMMPWTPTQVYNHLLSVCVPRNCDSGDRFYPTFTGGFEWLHQHNGVGSRWRL